MLRGINFIKFLILITFTLSQSAYSNKLFEHYSVQEGLSHTHVLSLFQDSKGFVWVGTYGGVHMFDGYKFQLYDYREADTNTISNNAVNEIFEDNKGYLWFGTENGLSRFNRLTGVFHRFYDDQNNSISNNSIKSIIQDDEGIIWIGTYGGGLNRFDPQTESFKVYNSRNLGVSLTEFDFINVVYEAGNNTLLIGTLGGLFVFDKLTKTVIKQIPKLDYESSDNTIINKIIDAEGGGYWIGTWSHGLFLYRNDIITKYQTHPLHERSESTSNIRDIVEDASGNIWLAHYGAGLTMLNTQSGKFNNYYYKRTSENGLSSNYAWSLMIDRSGNLWTGTFGGGLNKLRLEDYTFALKQIKGSNNNISEKNGVSAIYQDRGGTIWIGTLGAGLFKFDLNTNRFTPHKASVHSKSNAIRAIFESNDHRLWVGADDGLYCYDSSRYKVFKYRHDSGNSLSISQYPIYCLNGDHYGNLWIGMWVGGVSLLPKTEQLKENPDRAEFTRYLSVDGDVNTLGSNIIYSICEGEEGNVWVGTAEGLDKIDVETNTVEQVNYSITSSIIPEDDNKYWVSTMGNGLFLLDDKGNRLEHYSSSNELPDNSGLNLPNATVLGMHRANNQLWITTNKGLTVFNIEKNKFNSYNLEEELRQNALTLNTVLQTREGAVLIGGVDGLNVIWPDSLLVIPEPESLVFTDFKINNRSVVKGIGQSDNVRIHSQPYLIDNVELKYYENTLTIEFAALDYVASQNVNYSFILEGFDEHWVNTSSDRKVAYYSNLSPGNYLFKLKSTDSRGTWLENTIELSINILPPYWKTVWFKLILLVFISSLIITVIKIRTRNLLKQKQRLELLVTEKTSEILIKNIKLEEKNRELERQKSEIEKISNAVRQANEKKLRFFTSMSHEFRTPLTLILGPLENLKEKLNGKNEHSYYINVIQKNAYRLLRLINDILDLRKVDTKNMKITCSFGDIVKFSKSLIEGFQSAAHAAHISLDFNSTDISYNTWFDQGKIEIILYNLLSNALRHTPAGGKVNLQFEYQQRKQQILFCIADTGSGISKKDLERIFDRFYRAESKEQFALKGTGIGLSLTKDVVDLLNGSIKVESKAAKGTKFTVILPVIKPEEKKNDLVYSFLNRKGLEAPYQISPIQLQREVIDKFTDVEENEKDAAKVLIVEDEYDLRKLVASCLNDKYQVLEATNGNEAFKIAKEHQPALIITDIRMPEMDGVEFCKHVKNDLVISHIPIILLSAHTSIEMQIEGFETGADAFVSKPFNRKFLQTRVDTIIKQRESLRQLFGNSMAVEPKKITVSSVDEEFILKANELVETNIDNPAFGVNELIEGMGVSRTLAHMKFTKLTNCSTGEFIRTIRLNRACQLLKEGNHRVSEISYLAGFNDPQNFSKVFKKHFGQTPTEYSNNQ